MTPDSIEKHGLPFRVARPCVEKRTDGSLIIWQDIPQIAPWRSIAHLFVSRARSVPDRTLVAEPSPDGFIQCTYGDMLDRAARIAAGLQHLGLRPGDRIAMLSGPGIDHAALMLAAMLAGVVSVPVTEASALSGDPTRLNHALALTKPAIVFADDAVRFGAALENAKKSGARCLVRGSGPGSIGELEQLTEAANVDQCLAAIGPDTVFKLLWTSGTGSMPRATIQTHAMSCATLAFEASISRHGDALREPDVVLDWLPWAHVGGAVTIFNNVLLAGASLYIDAGRPIAGRFGPTIRNLKQFPQDVYASPPAAFAMLVDAMDEDPDLRRKFFSRLAYVKSGAAGMLDELCVRFQAHSVTEIGRETPILMSYGTTETHGVLSVTWDTRAPYLLGLPKPGVVVKLVPHGDVFALRIKAASVTPGYYRDAEATLRAFDDEGFFDTGDLARFDPDVPRDGLRFAGRSGEAFKMSTGTWVHSGSIRTQLLEQLSGLVSDCLVVGENRDELGLLVWGAGERTEIAARIGAYNRTAGGSAKRIGRLWFSARPIQPDHFERTEKGTLNRTAILANRADEVVLLFASEEARLAS